MYRISLPDPEAEVDFQSIPSYIVLKTEGKSNMKEGMRYWPISYSDQVRISCMHTAMSITITIPMSIQDNAFDY
jgi:hypothetical protein